MSVDNFAILAFVDPIGIVTTPRGIEISLNPVHWSPLLDSRWIAYGMADLISKPAWRYDIGSTPEFWVISSSQNDPLLGPQFHPPVWSIGVPIPLCPCGAGTQFQVVHSDGSPRSCLLPCEPLALPWLGEPRVRTMPILVILAS